MSEITQAQIEKWILEEARKLEQCVQEIATLAKKAANDDSEFKIAHAKARLKAKADSLTKMSDASAEDYAIVETADLRRQYNMSTALLDSAKKSFLAAQARLDALRTLNASVRANS